MSRLAAARVVCCVALLAVCQASTQLSSSPFSQFSQVSPLLQSFETFPTLQKLRGGSSDALGRATAAVTELEEAVAAGSTDGAPLSDFGERCRRILATADESVRDAVTVQIRGVYAQHLTVARQAALATYQTAVAAGETDAAALLQADAVLVAAATNDLGLDYAQPRRHLSATLTTLAAARKKAAQEQTAAAVQQQTALQFLQHQQQMIQQLQQQLYGQSSPWNCAAAYRVPDTNFNVQASYQQGRANVQLSCVPDEYAPFLGPNGFTNGVGPGNLGLSVNLSL